jgi:CheY-like chemotaxis protein
MNKTGPIVILEDDIDDRELLAAAFAELKFENEIVYFGNGAEGLEYLKQESVYPFLILSDINMPLLDGFRLKEMVHTNDEISKKCIPYLFFTTSVGKKAVHDAYTMSAQGFFLKPDRYELLKDTLRTIVEYWQKCYSPNNFDKDE